MKKQKTNSKLNLKRNVISNFEVNAVIGKGPDTQTCGCFTNGRNCKTYQITSNCPTYWCTEYGCQ